MSKTSEGGSVGRPIVRGMITLVFFAIFLKLGGFLMYWLLQRYFGTGAIMDAFTGVYGPIVIGLFSASALKIILPVFMPLFAEQVIGNDEKRAWDFAITAINLTMAAGIAAASFSLFFSPRIISIILPKFTPEAHEAAVRMLRWMSPGIIGLFFAIIAQGILNSHKIFRFPPAGEATQKFVWVGVIFVTFLLLGIPGRNKELAPDVIGAAFLGGCAAQVAVLLWGIRPFLKHYRLSFPLLSIRRFAVELFWIGCAIAAFPLIRAGIERIAPPEQERSFYTITALALAGSLYAVAIWLRGRKGGGLIARAATLAAPLLVGIIFARYSDLTQASFQSYAEKGGFSLIELAKKVANLPIMVAFTLSVAMFPFLCDLAAKKDQQSLGRVVGGSIRMLAIGLLPLTAVTIVLSAPIMRLLFDNGKWDVEQIYMARLALSILSTSIFFMAIENVLMQTYFSMQRTILPTVLGIICAVLPSLALWLLIDRLKMAAHAFLFVCIAWAARRIVKNSILLVLVHARIPLISGHEVFSFGLRLLCVTTLPAAAAWSIGLWFARLMPSERFAGRALMFALSKGAQVAVPALAALIIFLLLCVLLRVEEFRTVIQWTRERGWKKRGGLDKPADADFPPN